MFNSCPETNKLPFALSLMSNEYSNHIHVVIIPILLYHIFHGHRLPESFCVRVPEDMYPVILHSEPNRRQKLSLLADAGVYLVLSVSAPASLLPFVSCYPFQPLRCLQTLGFQAAAARWPKAAGFRSKLGESRRTAAWRVLHSKKSLRTQETETCRSAGVIDESTHGGCVMQRGRQTTQASVLCSCIFCEVADAGTISDRELIDSL